jgi:hypothetical protein
MIEFKEDEDSAYNGRTFKNASADVTLAIACDFTTGGEILTKRYVIEQEKLYIPINIDIFTTQEDFKKTVSIIVKAIDGLGKDEISLNIAGNGIYRFKDSFVSTQQMIDYLIYSLLKEINANLKTKISLVRTGGQSGADESGAKAGVKLGIPTLVLAPKGWRFRDINEINHTNEETFKNRFI